MSKNEIKILTVQDNEELFNCSDLIFMATNRWATIEFLKHIIRGIEKRAKGMTGPAALREAQLWLRDVTRKELGDYYKTYMRMTAQDSFETFMEMIGAPDDRPYENPFYWAAFTYNGASI